MTPMTFNMQLLHCPIVTYFFTEKRLKHLVTQKLLQFDKLYGCDVQSNLSGAIASLEKLQQDTA